MHPGKADSEFHDPDFTSSFDPQGYFDLVPDDEVVKGFVILGILDEVERRSPKKRDEILDGIEPKRFQPALDYPLATRMRLLLRAAPIIYPRLSTREALRRFGWMSHAAMKSNAIERLVFAEAEGDPDKIMAAGAKALAVSLKRGRVQATKAGTKHWRFDWEQVYGFLDTYFVGVVEGALRDAGALPRIRVRMRSLVDGTFDVTWV